MPMQMGLTMGACALLANTSVFGPNMFRSGTERFRTPFTVATFSSRGGHQTKWGSFGIAGHFTSNQTNGVKITTVSLGSAEFWKM